MDKKGKARGRARDGSNPFESRPNKAPKMAVLNRRVKGSDRNVAQARASALDRRGNAFAADAERLRKPASRFKDRRIGEYNSELSQDDKMALRFREQRRKRARATSSKRFSLEDGEGEDTLLTHKGQPIADGPVRGASGASDDDEDELDARTVGALHFGGGAGDGGGDNRRGDRPKSFVDEMIDATKAKRAQKAMSKEQQEDAVDKMDAAFSELTQHLTFRSKEPNARAAAPKRPPAAPADDDDQDANYEQEMRALSFERRVAAGERTKTGEEIARGEREQLEQLENERVKRMLGNDDDEHADGKRQKTRKRRERTDDDLSGSDGEPEVPPGARRDKNGIVWQDEIDDKDDDDDDGGDDDNDDDDDDDDDDGDSEEEDDDDELDDSGDGDDSEALLGEGNEDEDANGVAPKPDRSRGSREQPASEPETSGPAPTIPFVFQDCPANHAQARRPRSLKRVLAAW